MENHSENKEDSEIFTNTETSESLAIDSNNSHNIAEDNDIEMESESNSEIVPKPPLRSGYMLFAQENRSQITGMRVSEQSKHISTLWNRLNDEQKNEYKKKVNEQKRIYEEYLAKHPELKNNLNSSKKSKQRNQSTNDLELPYGRIKKIIDNDTDIKRISKESGLLITRATEIFIGKLSEKAGQKCMNHGRKNIQYNDFVDVLYGNRNFMFLRHVFPKNMNHSINSSGIQSSKSENSSQILREPPKKKQRRNPPQNSNQNAITNFFQKQT